jgi:hemerythrin superfamily protein
VNDTKETHMATETTDVTQFLTSQHREVDQLWSRLRDARLGGGASVSDLSQQIVTLLSQHDALETQLLYSELRDLGDEGRHLADHSLDEHKVVRELLTRIDGKDPREDSVFADLTACMTNVMQHVREEEGQVFPLMRERCDTNRLHELGERMQSMMKMAPTHPHPHTPDSKIGATVAGAVAGMADKARDAMGGRSGGRTDG